MICNLCKLDKRTRFVPFITSSMIEMNKHLKEAHGVTRGLLGWGEMSDDEQHRVRAAVARRDTQAKPAPDVER